MGVFSNIKNKIIGAFMGLPGVFGGISQFSRSNRCLDGLGDFTHPNSVPPSVLDRFGVVSPIIPIKLPDPDPTPFFWRRESKPVIPELKLLRARLKARQLKNKPKVIKDESSRSI